MTHSLVFLISLITGATALIAGAIVWTVLRLRTERRRGRAETYLLRWLTSEQNELLTRAGIPLRRQVADDGEECLAFDSARLHLALKQLRSRVVVTVPQKDKTVHELVLRPAATRNRQLRRLKVHLDGRIRHGKRGTLQLIRDAFLPSVQREIVVHVVNRNPAPIHDDKFHIFVQPSSRSGSVYAPVTLWGVPVEERSWRAATAHGGVPIIDEASGCSVAELAENCLYIHANVLDSGGSEYHLALLLRILQAADEELDVNTWLAEVISTVPDCRPAAAMGSSKSVFDHGFQGRLQSVVRSLVQAVLAPAAGRDVYIKHCQGTCEKPLDDGMFHIFLHSAPVGRACVQAPERLWGHRLIKRENSFLPSGRGLPIVEQPSGFAVGELVDNNLYIYPELVEYGTKSEARLLARLLTEVRRWMSNGTPSAVAERYVDECWSQIEGFLDNASKESTAAEARKAEEALRQALRVAQASEKDLYQLEASPSEELGREFDELCSIPKVLSVQVNDKVIVVTTDTLYCVDTRTRLRHEIGAFEIHIPTSSSSSILWFNRTRHVQVADKQKMQAPHVAFNGHACLGNTKDLFPMLINKRELATAVQLAIAFIESVNVDDRWGTHISKWPIAHS